MKNDKKYVVGVDGGGTKTTAALADQEGNILKKEETGPSSPRNVGLERAERNLSRIVIKVAGGKKISSLFVGLASVFEQPEYKDQIRRLLLERKEIDSVLEGDLVVGSDQLVAFRSGTDEKEGVVLIAGTGCVAHGWREGKESHASGWGWLADEGSAFWVGQRSIQAIFKGLDHRGPETKIAEIAFRELGIEDEKELIYGLYSRDFVPTVSMFSFFCEEAAAEGDKTAKRILRRAGDELAVAAGTAIKNLEFEKTEFPLVLVGGMIGSEITLGVLKEKIRGLAPKARFKTPDRDPVVGAVRLALENI